MRTNSEDSVQVNADPTREQRVQREIERLTDAVAQMGLSTVLTERLRKAGGEPRRQLALEPSAVAPLPSAIRAECTRW